MRIKIAVGVVMVLALLAAGVTLTYALTGSKAKADTPPVVNTEPANEVAGCCVTGDCCCPGQGSYCDPAAKAKAATAVKAASCCLTGDCCCPGHGSCCAPAGADCCKKN